jgi:hypothetical protein
MGVQDPPPSACPNLVERVEILVLIPEVDQNDITFRIRARRPASSILLGSARVATPVPELMLRLFLFLRWLYHGYSGGQSGKRFNSAQNILVCADLSLVGPRMHRYSLVTASASISAMLDPATHRSLICLTPFVGFVLQTLYRMHSGTGMIASGKAHDVPLLRKNMNYSLCAATALVAIVSLVSETSEAADVSENDTSGFYLAVAASRVSHDLPTSPIISVPLPVQHLSSDDVDSGYSAGVGYRINRYLAAEVAYAHFGELYVEEQYGSVHLDYGARVRGPTVSVLGSLPLGEQWELFVRGGMLFAETRVSHFAYFRSTSRPRPDREYSDEAFFGGAGVQWKFAPRVAARLEYQRTQELKYDNAESSGGIFDVLDEHENSMNVLSLGIVTQF